MNRSDQPADAPLNRSSYVITQNRRNINKKRVNIELIPPSNTPKAKTPDFMMDGKAWEMKSPQGKSRVTVEHAFKRAAKQSENIIIDLRRTKIPTNESKASLEKLFKTSRRVKDLKIITKEQGLLDLKK